MPYRILIADDALSARMPPESPKTAYKVPPADLVALAKEYALKWGVSYERMSKLIGGDGTGICPTGESSWNILAHNYNPPVEDSWGLGQINLLAHPEITKEQAIDPDFALNFIAENLSTGKSYLWTCA